MVLISTNNIILVKITKTNTTKPTKPTPAFGFTSAKSDGMLDFCSTAKKNPVNFGLALMREYVALRSMKTEGARVKKKKHKQSENNGEKCSSELMIQLNQLFSILECR